MARILHRSYHLVQILPDSYVLPGTRPSATGSHTYSGIISIISKNPLDSTECQSEAQRYSTF